MDDFRFHSHQLLIELDAATTQLMMLVSSRQVSGDQWVEATCRHKNAYDAWTEFLNEPLSTESTRFSSYQHLNFYFTSTSNNHSSLISSEILGL